MFMPVESTRALFVPPVDIALLQGSAAAWEKVGMKLFPAAASVVMIEAAKQMYAQPVAVEPKRKRALDAVPQRPQGLNRNPSHGARPAARQSMETRS